MLAKTAKKLVAKFLKDKETNSEINYQRQYVLDGIEREACLGRNLYVLDLPPYVHLFEDDYKYFESLGYTVQRPEIKYFFERGTQPIKSVEFETIKVESAGRPMQEYKFGIISW